MEIIKGNIAELFYKKERVGRIGTIRLIRVLENQLNPTTEF
jgi:hypothetical protein